MHVTTPPRVHPAERDAALHRIAKRRAAADDERFGFIDSESPGQVLDFIVDNPYRRHPHLTRADVEDGLVLWVWLWRRHQHMLLKLMRNGEAADMPLERMGTPLGLGRRTQPGNDTVRNRRQGTRRRMDRLQALLEYDVPDADLVRTARQVVRDRREGENKLVAWLVRHHDAVVAVAGHLLTLRPLAKDNSAALAWWDEIARDYRDDEWSEASIPVMRLFLGELRADPALENRSEIRQARRQVDTLSAASADFSVPIITAED